MKKIILLSFVLLSTLLAEAKTEKSGKQFNDSVKTEKLVQIEEKLQKQEKDIETLKAENLSLKKEISEVKYRKSFPAGGRKVTVSRTGSKQLIVE